MKKKEKANIIPFEERYKELLKDVDKDKCQPLPNYHEMNVISRINQSDYTKDGFIAKYCLANIKDLLETKEKKDRNINYEDFAIIKICNNSELASYTIKITYKNISSVIPFTLEQIKDPNFIDNYIKCYLHTISNLRMLDRDRLNILNCVVLLDETLYDVISIDNIKYALFNYVSLLEKPQTTKNPKLQYVKQEEK